MSIRLDRDLGVARNSSGEILALMVVCDKVTLSLFAAEAYVCYQALRFGVRLGLDSVVIEGDSLKMIKICRSDRRDKSKIGTIIANVQHYMFLDLQAHVFIIWLWKV